MNNNKIFIVGAIVAAVAVFVALKFMNKAPEPTADTTGAVFNFDPSLLIRDHSPTKGPADAKVTLVEFMDPQCEACAAMHPILKKLMKEYDGRVRLVIRVLPFHDESMYAGSLLFEAKDSGKFEEALDVFTEHLHDWGGHHNARPELLADYMVKVGIDKMRTDRKYALGKHEEKIKMDETDAQKLGVNRTPTFFVNGVQVQELGYEPLKAAIDASL